MQIIREMQQSCQQRVGEEGRERHRLGLTGVKGCACKVRSGGFYILQNTAAFAVLCLQSLARGSWGMFKYLRLAEHNRATPRRDTDGRVGVVALGISCWHQDHPVGEYAVGRES